MTHYDVLGIDEDASAEEIHAAWRLLIREVHPDHATDTADEARRTAEATRLNEAHRVLSDPLTKAAYDREIEHEENTWAAAVTRPSAAPEVARPATYGAAARQTAGQGPSLLMSVVGWALADESGQWISMLLLALACFGAMWFGALGLSAATDLFVSVALPLAIAQAIVGRRLEGTPLGRVLGGLFGLIRWASPLRF